MRGGRLWVGEELGFVSSRMSAGGGGWVTAAHRAEAPLSTTLAAARRHARSQIDFSLATTNGHDASIRVIHKYSVACKSVLPHFIHSVPK
jgi:hypothetical protein